MEITIDITGSSGAAMDGHQNQTTVTVQARSLLDVAYLKLFGDWKLKIKFSYQVLEASPSSKEEEKSVPEKARRSSVDPSASQGGRTPRFWDEYVPPFRAWYPPVYMPEPIYYFDPHPYCPVHRPIYRPARYSSSLRTLDRSQLS